jgi:hypothetical protein
VHKWLCALAFMVGVFFLGTSEVSFAFEGNSKGATGFAIGVAGIGVGIHQSVLFRRRRQALDLQTTASRSKGARSHSKRKRLMSPTPRPLWATSSDRSSIKATLWLGSRRSVRGIRTEDNDGQVRGGGPK